MKSANAIKINRKSGVAEGPAVRLDAKQRSSLLRHCTPGKLFRDEQRARLRFASSLVGPLFDVKAHSRSLHYAALRSG